jgi:hypothetical protein
MKRTLGSIMMAVVLLAAGTSPSSAQIRPKAPKNKQGVLPNQGRVNKQKGQPGEALERFLQLSPAERRAALQRLPAERRREIMRRLQALELLAPEELQQLRGRYQIFSGLPPARRQAIREELRQLRQLPQPERRRRLADPELRGRFSEEELQLLYEVAGQPEQ